MIKDIIESNDNKKINEDKIEKLKQIVPNCFDKDGKLDVELLKKEFNQDLEFTKESYELNFLGKSYAKMIAGLDTETVVEPDAENNEKEENKNSQNIYISGDNLDALKHLLKAYENKIKCIYIDPPYNTGSDGFVYNDTFKFTKETLVDKLDISQEEAQRILNMTSSNSSSHSAWLTFMYPRLYLARQLLTDDGVIFISIDDNEQAQLKMLCDGIYGEENYIDTLKWKRKKQPSFLNKHTAKLIEYVLVYGKDSDSLEKLSIDNVSDLTKKVINISNDYSVRHFKAGVRVKLNGKGIIKAGIYSIKTMNVEYLNDVYYENGRTTNEVDVKAKFQTNQENIDSYISEDLLFITVNFGLRRDVSKEESKKRKSITDLLLDYGDNQDSDKEQIKLFKSKVFDYSKPTKLIFNLVKSTFTENEYILDFFSGSATTAHAVMQLNAEDGGNRKYIMVQLPEHCDKKSEAYQAGYKTIDEIGQERIRRAAKKIKDETGADIDYGFKHYVLKDTPDNLLNKLERFEPTIINDSYELYKEYGIETILETWKLKDGYMLTDDVKVLDLGGYEAYTCSDVIYLITPNINIDNIEALLEKYAKSEVACSKLVLFGYSFTFDEIEMIKNNIRQTKSIKNIDVKIYTRY